MSTSAFGAAPRVYRPLDPRCPMHLRRICGTCEHFEGPAMTAKGRCGHLRGRTAGGANAAKCEAWTRRTAPHSGTSDPQPVSDTAGNPPAPAPRRPQLDPAQVMAAYEAAGSAGEAAARLGCSVATVYRHLSAAQGGARKAPSRARKGLDRDAVVAAFRAHGSLSAAGRALGCCPTTVKHHLRQAGIQ